MGQLFSCGKSKEDVRANQPTAAAGNAGAAAPQTKPQNSGSTPALSGTKISDGKVEFDKAALSIAGVLPKRDAEVAQLNRALDVKKEAGAATGKANELHEQASKLYDQGDKEGNKKTMEESKKYREIAKQKHQESFDLAYGVAMSMAWKAVYSEHPEIDFHVFLLDPFEKAWPEVVKMVQKQNKFKSPTFLVIPGAGTHSDKDKGPKIKPALLEWFKQNNIKFSEETHGSYLMTF